MIGRFWIRWRLALRLGSRDALRHRGRSLLVIVLLGLPVLLAAAGGTVIASHAVTAREGRTAAIGQAQAVAANLGGKVEQSPDGSDISWGSDKVMSVEQAEVQLEQLTEGTVIPVLHGMSRALLGGKIRDLDVIKTDLDSDMTRGIVELTQGRLPVDRDEAVVTQVVADSAGGLGLTVVVGGQKLKIVGIGTVGTVGRDPGHKGVAILPDTPVVIDRQVDGDTQFLIDRNAPVTWSDVRELNKHGFVVISREVLDNPPSGSEQYAMSGFSSGFGAGVVAIIVTAMMLEVVLLAGPAFAVGARRQRRSLGLLAATGGSPADLRRVVIGQALAISVPASIASGLLGIGLGGLAWWLGPGLGLSMGPFDVPWLPIAGIAVLGVVAAGIAALVPAVSASRAEVVASLQDREPRPTSRRGWPLVGAILVVVGLVGTYANAKPGGEARIAALTIATVLGAVLLTPWLISRVALLARWLPLPMRLALRDANRHRSRTAPAVAAIMASLAAVTAFAIATASDAAEGEGQVAYEAPVGAVRLTATNDRMDAVVRAAEVATGATFTPLRQLGTLGGEDASSVIVFRPDPGYPGSASSAPVVIGDSEVLRAWGVQLAASDLAALDAGKVLVADPEMIVDGTVALEIGPPDGEGARQERVPAVAADLTMGEVPNGIRPEVGGAVVPVALAAKLNLPVTRTSAMADRQASSFDDLAGLQAAVLRADPARGDVVVSTVQKGSISQIVPVLGGLGVIAILIGTFSATALALNDARADLRTLAAVGARPRSRRLVTGSMAYLLALLGALLGVLVGFGPGLAATVPRTTVGGDTSPTVEVPWLMLVTLVVVVPLAVALVVAAVTRSKLPVVGKQTA